MQEFSSRPLLVPTEEVVDSKTVLKEQESGGKGQDAVERCALSKVTKAITQPGVLAWQPTPVISALWEVEAARSLEARSLKPAWPICETCLY